MVLERLGRCLVIYMSWEEDATFWDAALGKVDDIVFVC